MQLPVPYHSLDWRKGETFKVREEYIRRQKGKCFFCKEPLDGDPPQKVRQADINWRLFPKNFLRHPVHLQHDHFTGLTEGAVHALCNAYWWQFEGR